MYFDNIETSVSLNANVKSALPILSYDLWEALLQLQHTYTSCGAHDILVRTYIHKETLFVILMTIWPRDQKTIGFHL